MNGRIADHWLRSIGRAWPPPLIEQVAEVLDTVPAWLELEQLEGHFDWVSKMEVRRALAELVAAGRVVPFEDGYYSVRALAAAVDELPECVWLGMSEAARNAVCKWLYGLEPPARPIAEDVPSRRCRKERVE